MIGAALLKPLIRPGLALLAIAALVGAGYGWGRADAAKDDAEAETEAITETVTEATERAWRISDMHTVFIRADAPRAEAVTEAREALQEEIARAPSTCSRSPDRARSMRELTNAAADRVREAGAVPWPPSGAGPDGAAEDSGGAGGSGTE
jgi:hypothetical protein